MFDKEIISLEIITLVLMRQIDEGDASLSKISPEFMEVPCCQ